MFTFVREKTRACHRSTKRTMITRKRMVSKMRSGMRQSRSLLASALVVLVLLPPVSADPAQADGASDPRQPARPNDVHLGPVLRNAYDITTYTACYVPQAGSPTCIDQIVGDSITVGPVTFSFGYALALDRLGIQPRHEISIDSLPGTHGEAFVVFEAPSASRVTTQYDVGLAGETMPLPTSATVTLDMGATPLVSEPPTFTIRSTIDALSAQRIIFVSAVRELRTAQGCATCWASYSPMTARVGVDGPTADVTLAFKPNTSIGVEGLGLDAQVVTPDAREIDLHAAMVSGLAPGREAVETRVQLLGANATAARIGHDEAGATFAVAAPETHTLEDVAFNRVRWSPSSTPCCAGDTWSAQARFSGAFRSVNMSLPNGPSLRYQVEGTPTTVGLDFTRLHGGLEQPSLSATLSDAPHEYRLSLATAERDPRIVSVGDTPTGKLDVSSLWRKRLSASVVEAMTFDLNLAGVPEAVTTSAMADGTLLLQAHDAAGNDAPIAEATGCYTHRGGMCVDEDGGFFDPWEWPLGSEHVILRHSPGGTSARWHAHDLYAIRAAAPTAESIAIEVGAASGAPLGITVKGDSLLWASIQARASETTFATMNGSLEYSASSEAEEMHTRWYLPTKGGWGDRFFSPVPEHIVLSPP